MVRFRYYDLSDAKHPVLEAEADAERLQAPDGHATIFAHERVFDRAGHWGVEVQARFPDGTTAQKGIAFASIGQFSSLESRVTGCPIWTLRLPPMSDGDLHMLTSAPSPIPFLCGWAWPGIG